jgi:myotubularin-related protein 9
LDSCADPGRDRRGFIIDLRTTSEVSTQKGKGGGVEDEKHYFDWKVVNAQIGKIKEFEEGMKGTFDAVQSDEDASASFLSKVDSSMWLHNVKTLLSTAVVISRTLLRESLPVVVHGTVGCDLAAQASSLAQLLLDPYFRTYKGFQRLIEKEWLQSGHPFSSRNNHINSGARAGSKSPVFVMWLDAVWQCTQQYPWEFEFNEQFLLLLAKHVAASEFGTFLYDNEQERVESGVRTKTASLWAFLNVADERKLLSNPVWQPSDGWLKPSFKPESMKIWTAFFGQGTPYLFFHEEVDELLIFLNDRGGLLAAEVERKKGELAKLEAELATQQRLLAEETGGGGGGGDDDGSENMLLLAEDAHPAADG